jgi:UDP-N-acetylmuramyl pentapeptide phosphotransferase/UDP-N-acetylglucosamine-1-phosphate transferase
LFDVGIVSALAAALLIAAAAGYLIVRYAGTHSHFLADAPGTGPQKFHSTSTPRVGGIPILLGLMAAAALLADRHLSVFNLITAALVCGLCALAGGLAEDFTKRVGVGLRLLLTFASAALGFVILDARIAELAVPGLDWLLNFTAISFVFTLFAIGGFANAMNIVDGFHGLAGVVALIFLSCIAYVAGQVGDESILSASLVVGGALIGFLVLNFPRGLIFLGDGGAYFVGFLIAELAVLLVHRNSQVSPWFALTMLSYPIVETFFSMYRKKLLRKQSPGMPDGLHFHMLIHKRLVRRYEPATPWANAATSPFLWALALLGAAPAVLFWDNTAALQASLVSFVALYAWLYWRIVRFRTPKLLVARQWFGNRRSTLSTESDVASPANADL